MNQLQSCCDVESLFVLLLTNHGKLNCHAGWTVIAEGWIATIPACQSRLLSSVTEDRRLPDRQYLSLRTQHTSWTRHRGTRYSSNLRNLGWMFDELGSDTGERKLENLIPNFWNLGLRSGKVKRFLQAIASTVHPTSGPGCSRSLRPESGFIRNN